MTLNCPNNCETHEQKRNVVRPDYLALSISGRKLHSQNGTQNYGEDIKINDDYSLHFDVNSNKITIKAKNGETINIDSSYLTDIQNVLNSDMPQEQKETERTKLDWYLAEKVILSLPKGFIEKPNSAAAIADAKKMGHDVVAQGAKVPWSNETIRGIVKKSDTEKKGNVTDEVADALGGDTSHTNIFTNTFVTVLGGALNEEEMMKKFSDTLNSINAKLTNIQQTLDKNGQVQSLENKVSVSIMLEGAIKELNQVMNTIFDSYKGGITEDVTNAITEGFEKLMNKFTDIMKDIKNTISTQSDKAIASMKQTFDIFEKSLGELQKTMETVVASNENLKKQNGRLQKEMNEIKVLLEGKGDTTNKQTTEQATEQTTEQVTEQVTEIDNKKTTAVTTVTTIVDGGDTAETDDDKTFFNNFLKEHDNLTQDDDGFRYFICPDDSEEWGDDAGEIAKNRSLNFFDDNGNTIATIHFDDDGKASICKRIINNQNVYYTFENAEDTKRKKVEKDADALEFIGRHWCDYIDDQNQEEIYQNLQKARDIIQEGKRTPLHVLYEKYQSYLKKFFEKKITINDKNEENIIALLQRGKEYELAADENYARLYYEYQSFVLTSLKEKYGFNIGDQLIREKHTNYVNVGDNVYELFNTEDMRLYNIKTGNNSDCNSDYIDSRDLKAKLTNKDWIYNQKEQANIPEIICNKVKKNLGINSDTTVTYNNETYKIGKGHIDDRGNISFDLIKPGVWNTCKRRALAPFGWKKQPTISASELKKVLQQAEGN